ncbi:acylphosphatase [Hymenobacter koreensis]|uniref:acylphosphatase n=1 Tax=Hymenobacter koreensis TaxID=1084523 RepID=A0ABP8ITS3_9BACT
MAMTTHHRIFRIHGRVQGVFFRQSAKRKATELGLHGYTCNNPDGTVTIEAEGSAEALSALEVWCQHGPPAARVDRVETQTGEMQGFRAFEVRQ